MTETERDSAVISHLFFSWWRVSLIFENVFRRVCPCRKQLEALRQQLPSMTMTDVERAVLAVLAVVDGGALLPPHPSRSRSGSNETSVRRSSIDSGRVRQVVQVIESQVAKAEKDKEVEVLSKRGMTDEKSSRIRFPC